MEQLKVFLQNDVHRIFVTFSRLLNVRISFYSKAWQSLTAGKGIGMSPLCSFIREEMGLNQECERCDREKRELCVKSRQPLSYRCHAGLAESITPVFIMDELIGFVMIGQIRNSQAIKPHLLEECRNKKQQSQLQRIFANQPYIPPRRLRDIFQLFNVLVGAIVHGNLVAVNRNVVLSRALAYIDANLDKTITLNQLARYCGRSRSTITHLFYNDLRKSFKQILIEKKIGKALSMLSENRNLTIGEVADSLSFCDPFYFSKIFKKVKGFPPSAIRKNDAGMLIQP